MVYPHFLLLAGAAGLVAVSTFETHSETRWQGHIVQNQQGEYVLHSLATMPTDMHAFKPPERAYILGMKVDLRYATLDDLCDIPGIGRSIAQPEAFS